MIAKESEKLLHLGLLSAGLAHDVNNILTGVLGYLQLLKQDYPKEVKFAEMEKALLCASEICNFTLLNLHDDPLCPAPLDPSGIVSRAAELVWRLRGRDGTLTLDIPPLCPPITVSQTALHQIVQNLVLNAFEACPNGTTRVCLQQFPSHLVLLVENKQSTVAPRRSKNRGFGLKIVRRLCEESNAIFSMKNTSHGGRKISIQFPLHAL